MSDVRTLDDLREAIMDEGSLTRRRQLLAEFETAVGEKVAQTIEAERDGQRIPLPGYYTDCATIAREVTGGAS